MGDIIQRFKVRSGDHGPVHSMRLLFDTGSPFTFIKASAAAKLGGAMKLKSPRKFGGFGNGLFHATEVMDLSLHFLDVWCSELAYTVPDADLESFYEIVVGHGLMQRLDIRLRPRLHAVVFDRDRLLMSLRVR